MIKSTEPMIIAMRNERLEYRPIRQGARPTRQMHPGWTTLPATTLAAPLIGHSVSLDGSGHRSASSIDDVLRS
jgi:hypothetical protein